MITLRVMTYNVHACIGLDRRHDPDRIAHVIAQSRPDIVALQELDHGHARSRKIHQAQAIAEQLRFHYHFHAVRELAEERFGNAILSRFPLKLLRAAALPTVRSRIPLERRGALWVEADVKGVPVHIVNTHLGLRSRERLAQVKALSGPAVLENRDARIPLILCGDFNCGPHSSAYRELLDAFTGIRLRDSQLHGPQGGPRKTWPSWLPLRRLDHIFVGGVWTVRHTEVPSTRLSILASDHLPIVAELAMPSIPPA